ncbi:hypothetical protein HAX54_048758, partial [Datura stramonium]|nr:hypothetical protein [Datura stramonium]
MGFGSSGNGSDNDPLLDPMDCAVDHWSTTSELWHTCVLQICSYVSQVRRTSSSLCQVFWTTPALYSDWVAAQVYVVASKCRSRLFNGRLLWVGGNDGDAERCNYPAECEAHGTMLLPLHLVSKKDRHHTPRTLEVEEVSYDSFPHRKLILNHFHIPPIIRYGALVVMGTPPSSQGWLASGWRCSECSHLLSQSTHFSFKPWLTRNWISCILDLCAMLSKLIGGELWNSVVEQRLACGRCRKNSYTSFGKYGSVGMSEWAPVMARPNL